MKYLDVICVILVRKKDTRIIAVETCLTNSKEATYIKLNQIIKVAKRVNNELYKVHIQVNNTNK